MTSLHSRTAVFRDGLSLTARHRAWFAANFERLMVDRKVRPRAVALALKAKNVRCSESDLSRWKKGRIPDDDALEALADYFGVEVADLLRNPNSKPKSLADAGMIELIEEMARRVGMQVKKD